MLTATAADASRIQHQPTVFPQVIVPRAENHINERRQTIFAKEDELFCKSKKVSGGVVRIGNAGAKSS
jgi:hypothetical protein